MKPEDLIPDGDRAKRHLRIAQALAILSKTRAPTLDRVREALSRVQGNQPAVAMAIILAYSKRHPLREREEWLKAAVDALQQYQLSDEADKKEAELAKDYLENEIAAYNAEIQRIEKIRERSSLGILLLLLLLIAGGLIYIGYSFIPKPETAETKIAESNHADAKPVSGRSLEKQPGPKSEAEKVPATEVKKTERGGRPTNPAGK